MCRLDGHRRAALARYPQENVADLGGRIIFKRRPITHHRIRATFCALQAHQKQPEPYMQMQSPGTAATICKIYAPLRLRTNRVCAMLAHHLWPPDNSGIGGKSSATRAYRGVAARVVWSRHAESGCLRPQCSVYTKKTQ